MPCEIIIVMKDEEKTLRKKFLEYNVFTAHEMDPVIQRCQSEVRKEFASEPLNVNTTIKLIN